jgi:hypothetical protein
VHTAPAGLVNGEGIHTFPHPAHFILSKPPLFISLKKTSSTVALRACQKLKSFSLWSLGKGSFRASSVRPLENKAASYSFPIHLPFPPRPLCLCYLFIFLLSPFLSSSSFLFPISSRRLSSPLFYLIPFILSYVSLTARCQRKVLERLHAEGAK